MVRHRGGTFTDMAGAMTSGKSNFRVFISYRRSDSAVHAGRLYDRLSSITGDGHVFLDVDSIRPGEEFATVITTAVSESSILLVLIGQQWASSPDGSDWRLHDPNDYVRREIEAALGRSIVVIPVLINDAGLPDRGQIPESLHPLLDRHAIRIRDATFKDDAQRLLDSVKSNLDSIRTSNFKVLDEQDRRRRELKKVAKNAGVLDVTREALAQDHIAYLADELFADEKIERLISSGRFNWVAATDRRIIWMRCRITISRGEYLRRNASFGYDDVIAATIKRRRMMPKTMNDLEVLTTDRTLLFPHIRPPELGQSFVEYVSEKVH
jgi:hypothetical protein